MKTILLIGKNGQIGIELQKALAGGANVAAVDRESCNLERPDSIIACVRAIQPDIIINAAAYTAVDKAESEAELANAVNSIAPRILAEEAKRLRIPLVHYSTDYVFDGTATRPYRESDPTNPLNVYGRTKLAGEQAIAAVDGCYQILRTSWVYGDHGRNFYLTMLRLAGEREELRIVNDQTGTPNWSREVAVQTVKILPQLDQSLAGIYHLSCGGSTTWYGFAQAIFAHAALEKKPRLVPITTAEYPTPAKRPAYSSLDNRKICDAFNLALPTWEDASPWVRHDTHR